MYNITMVNLKPNETAEDLQCGGLRIIQSRDEYRFTTDAVLLANFCRDMHGKVCVEFGSGSGVVSILLSYKKHPKRIVALEIQPQLCDMMQRSVAMNGMQGIEVHNIDLKLAHTVVTGADVVVCNPPYRRVGSGERQLRENLALCRHELKATLSDIIAEAGRVLNNKGNLYLVHQAQRLCEIVTLCRDNGIAVKQILPVCPAPNKQPNLVLVRAVKGGEQDCVLSSPLCITDGQGNYTPQAKAWYGIAEDN